MKKSDIGLIGLGVMGENLALNMESRGFHVSVYNRPHPDKSAVNAFLQTRGAHKNFAGFEKLEEFVPSLSPPRKIFLMVKAGAPVDDTIARLLPLMDKGDIIIDGGNSDFHDSERRTKDLGAKGILFVGAGVSGGEEGALKGPSIMPGGNKSAWGEVKTILQKIAAQLDDGSPCCEWMGEGGAGHFVKMVHNGIEYGDMQLICEAYQLMKQGLNMDNDALAQTFEDWNKTELDSFLIEITSHIMNHKDPKGGYLLDNILDVAGQKGTGKWTVFAALDANNPLSLITQSVFARFMSAMYDERHNAAEIFSDGANLCSGKISREDIRKALYMSKIISYAQGFSLLARASKEKNWNLDLAAIANIWRKGCIIRADFLTKITGAYKKNPALQNLIFGDFFAAQIKDCVLPLRKVCAEAALSGISLPCFAGALSYFDAIRAKNSPANLIQAQRDYFGAHTYERKDSERGKFFHSDWANTGGKTHSGSYNV